MEPDRIYLACLITLAFCLAFFGYKRPFRKKRARKYWRWVAQLLDLPSGEKLKMGLLFAQTALLAAILYTLRA